MILKELMRDRLDVFKLSENARIADAAELMYEKRVGSVVIVDSEDFVVGIVTDRDIALTIALGAATSDSFVNEVMTRDVEVINETKSLLEVTQYFRASNVKRLPVVDQNGRLKGIVTLDDVIALLSREMFDACCSLESKLGHMV